MRRVRLTSRKGCRLYTLSMKRRIQHLTVARIRRHAIILRRSSRRHKVQQFQQVPLRILEEDESGLQVHNFGEAKGRGVISSRVFKKNEAILEYCGELLSKTEGEKREQSYPEDVGSYLYFFDHKGVSYCLDASKETYNLGRLVNHSRYRPNAYMKSMQRLDGKVILVLVALKTIKVGDEILYDYGERRKEVVALFPWLKT